MVLEVSSSHSLCLSLHIHVKQFNISGCRYYVFYYYIVRTVVLLGPTFLNGL